MSKNRGYTATSTDSVQNAVKNLTKFLRKLDTIPLEEIERSAETIKEEAVAQTPYRPSPEPKRHLEDAVYVHVSRDKRRPGLRAGASIVDRKSGYNYAGIQHADTSFIHPYKGKAHYISDPFNKEVHRLKRRIRSRLKVVE